MTTRKLQPGDVEALVELFDCVSDTSWFTPHPMDVLTATQICYDPGENIYLGLFLGERLVAYGMLRWAEGYQYPSLGVAVRADMRGRGFGKEMMRQLHQTAREANVQKIRLRVHSENERAISMYRGLGYELDDSLGPGHLVGWLTL